MTIEQLLIHRELEFLRAAGHAGARARRSPSKTRKAGARSAERWRKLQQARAMMQRQPERVGPCR